MVTEWSMPKTIYIKIRIQRADGGGPAEGLAVQLFGSDPRSWRDHSSDPRDSPFAAIDVNIYGLSCAGCE